LAGFVENPNIGTNSVIASYFFPHITVEEAAAALQSLSVETEGWGSKSPCQRKYRVTVADYKALPVDKDR
jgi:hypothetical protein